MTVEVDDSYADDEAGRVEVVDSDDGESDKWLSNDLEASENSEGLGFPRGRPLLVFMTSLRIKWLTKGK